MFEPCDLKQSNCINALGKIVLICLHQLNIPNKFFFPKCTNGMMTQEKQCSRTGRWTHLHITSVRWTANRPLSSPFTLQMISLDDGFGSMEAAYTVSKLAQIKFTLSSSLTIFCTWAETPPRTITQLFTSPRNKIHRLVCIHLQWIAPSNVGNSGPLLCSPFSFSVCVLTWARSPWKCCSSCSHFSSNGCAGFQISLIIWPNLFSNAKTLTSSMQSNCFMSAARCIRQCTLYTTACLPYTACHTAAVYPSPTDFAYSLYSPAKFGEAEIR